MSNDVSQQAQIISPVVDPFTNGFSWARIVSMGGSLLIVVCSAVFSLGVYPNILWIPSCFVCCLTLCIYIVFCRNDQTLSHNLNKISFKKRKMQGREGMGKYDENVTEKQVKSYIPWTGINEETGLSTYEYENAREYLGNYGFTVLAIPPAETDKDTLNEQFRRAFRAIPYRCSQKIIVMTGIDPTFILNDIDDLLKQPGLSPTRELELKSMQQTFTETKGSVERTHLIHITLGYTLHEEKAQAQMNKIMNGYMRLLNKKKIKTIVIKEADDMILIYQGMLTGKKLYGVV